MCLVCAEDLSNIPRVGEDGLVGMVLADRYELVDLIGEGGMAWVYKAIHRGLLREVAVKILKTAPEGFGEEQAVRFVREAQMASRLNHPHIVSVIDFGESPAGLMYLVTEYLKGKTLSTTMWEQRPLPYSRVMAIFHQVLTAIEEAHGAGVIHRDIKPENVIVEQLRSGDDFAKVLDFGIAVLAGPREGKVTQEGAFVGTPGFMSPEQIAGKEATERSDIYALGVMLFEMLAGRAAFEHESPMVVMTMQLQHDLPLLAEVVPEKCYPAELDQALARATAREPELRIGSIVELRNQVFEAFSKMSPVQLECASCTRPVDPVSGLCSLHARPAARAVSANAPTIALLSDSFAEPAATSRSDSIPAVSVDASAFVTDEIVGREQEIDQSAGFLAGKAHVLAVLGEPGIGKTELVRAIGRGCEQRLGIRTLFSGPDPRRAGTPWYPVRDLVGQVLGCGPAPESPDSVLAGAARVGVESSAHGLKLLYGFEAEGAPATGAERRNEINRSAVATLAAARGDTLLGPLVIADDADGFDRASLDFFRAVSALAKGTWLKVLLTAEREIGGFAGSHPSIKLEPLAGEVAGKLVDRLFADAAEKIHARMRRAVQTSGNPLHAIQAQNLLKDGGEPIGSLDAVLSSRLELLPNEALLLLRTIAIVGASVPMGSLSDVVDESQLFMGLEILKQRGFTVVGQGRLISAASPVVARAVLDGTPAGERQRITRALLDHFTSSGSSVFLRARLADEAGEFEQAVELLERAGDEALRQDDREDAAMVFYRRATHLSRWELLRSEEDAEHLRISLKMGSALSATGHRLSAEVVLKEVFAAAGRHPDLAKRAKDELASLSKA